MGNHAVRAAIIFAENAKRRANGYTDTVAAQKVNRVQNATTGNIAILDRNGNIVDSGSSMANIVPVYISQSNMLLSMQTTYASASNMMLSIIITI